MVKGIISKGRAGLNIKSSKGSGVLKAKKKESNVDPYTAKRYKGKAYEIGTTVFRKDLGGWLTSEGYVFKDKPKDFESLGTRGTRFGISGSGPSMGKLSGRSLPKAMKFSSFSDYFLKKELNGDTSSFNITKGKDNIITKITAKPKQYVTRGESRGGYSYGTYVPREVVFSDEGKIIKDVSRNVFKKSEEDDDDSWRYEKDVYDASEKLYENGVLKQEVSRGTYKSSDVKDDDRDSTSRAIFEKEKKLYDSGKLKKLIRQKVDDSVSVRDEDYKREEEKPYIEEIEEYDPQTGFKIREQDYDTYTEKIKYGSGGKKMYRTPYLRTEIDYLEGIKRVFPRGETKFQQTLTPEEKKQAQDVMYAQKNLSVLDIGGKKFVSPSTDWLQKKSSELGGGGTVYQYTI